MTTCQITTEYQRRGIDVVHLENEELRVEILAKGADITEIRDKRTDVNVLFEAPHEWHAPGRRHAAPSDRFAFLDHYPGGWQTILPTVGAPDTVKGAHFGAHGESTTVLWDVHSICENTEEVSVTLRTELTRFPLEIERTVILESTSSTVNVRERVTNQGEVTVPYQWLQHIALGRPLVSPEASLSVDAERAKTRRTQNANARVSPDTSFRWPKLKDRTEVNFEQFPAKERRVLDNLVLFNPSGTYNVSNKSLDLAATVTFDADQFPYLWYWGAFGGYEHSPFFGREYTLGLEPCTSSGFNQIDESTTSIEPDETISTILSLTTTSVSDST